MRLTDYLPHGPAMSTPPTERVRDVITARHSKENALLLPHGIRAHHLHFRFDDIGITHIRT